jgi:hypothetical protein
MVRKEKHMKRCALYSYCPETGCCEYGDELSCVSWMARNLLTSVLAIADYSGRSNTGIVGSNPTQGIDVCLRLFCVCVVGSGLATGWSPVQGFLPNVLRLSKWSETKRFTDALFSKWEQQERERERERERGSEYWVLASQIEISSVQLLMLIKCFCHTNTHKSQIQSDHTAIILALHGGFLP